MSESDIIPGRCSAESAIGLMERHLRNASSLDADSRQDSSRSDSLDESFVARNFVGDGKGPLHRFDLVWH